jgi:hypothetical protein
VNEADLLKHLNERGIHYTLGPTVPLPAAEVPPDPVRRSGMWTIFFRVWVETVSEMNQRSHWSERARRFKQQRECVRQAFHGCPFTSPFPPWTGRLRITLTRHGRRKLDPDNLASSFKGIQDAIAELIGVDDGNAQLEWVYKQKPCAKRKPTIGIHIERRKA